MRVNSSPSSLIGPVASCHVSAQLPLREHPQKPQADVPTRALQEEVLPGNHWGWEVPPGVPDHPMAWWPSCRSSRRALSWHRCLSQVGALQKVQHFFSSHCRESFNFKHKYASFLLLFIKWSWKSKKLLWRVVAAEPAVGALDCKRGHIPLCPVIQGDGKEGKENQRDVRAMEKRRQNPLSKTPKATVDFIKSAF